MLTDALARSLPALTCPVCREALCPRRTAEYDGPAVSALACPAGHAFDLARQGYVNLAAGRVAAGDSPAMVAARERFLGAGYFVPIMTAVGAAAGDPAGFVLDLAGGTGHYLAAVLDSSPDALGLCVDSSPAALRRAARRHPRIAAIGTSAWSALPLKDGSMAAVLSIFGPRDTGEIARVLSPAGRLVVVSPLPDHQRELVEPLGLIHVDARKPEREAAAFARFAVASRTAVRFTLPLGHAGVADLVGMGPSARHVPAADRAARIAALPEPVGVTIAVNVTGYVLPAP